MRVNFVDFFEGLITNGKPNPGLKFEGCDLKHSLYTPHYADKLHDVLSACKSDTLEFNGVLYSMVCSSIVSSEPFNVTGFIGDMGGFACSSRESMKRSIDSYIKLRKAWDEMKSCYDDISGLVRLQSQYFYTSDFAQNLVVSEIESAISYIKDHLAYNLVDKSAFDEPSPERVCKYVLGISDFDSYDSLDNLKLLPDAICFNKIKDWIVANFDENETDRKKYEVSARRLIKEFVAKSQHKAFDKFKVSYYSRTYSWEQEKPVSKKDFKDWFNNLRIVCIDQGLGEWYEQFSLGLATEFENVYAGESVVCSGVAIRVYKEHITISLPKNVSMAIGVFINKFAHDDLVSHVG